MGNNNRRLIGPKRKKKVKIPSPVVELPPFEHAGFEFSTGLQKVARLLKSTSSEVQENILCECKIIYECRLCREMFRDVNEFLNHKKEICKERQSTVAAGPMTRSRARTNASSSSLAIETVNIDSD